MTVTKLLRITAHTFVFGVLLLYWTILAHIPLLHFITDPTWGLGVWLVGVILSLVIFVWVIRAFNWIWFLGWLLLVAGLHGAMWWGEDVHQAFESDRCLDGGGAWRDGQCVK